MPKSLLSKILVMGVILLFVCVSFTGSSYSLSMSKSQMLSFSGNILYVGGSGEGNYTTIQGAIDDANDGDTVYVYDDSSPYLEYDILINKSIKLVGENRDTTIIDGLKKSNVVIIKNTENVEIKSLTITNCTFYRGKRVEFGAGIRIENSDYSNISDNNIIKNGRYGVLIDKKSRYTMIHHNDISHNDWAGVYAGNAIYIMIYDNIVDNNYWGIRIWGEAGHYTISRNTITRNRNGIVDSGYGKNTISENIISYNEEYGIMWGSDNKMTIIKNNISNNGYTGIDISVGSANISENYISNNGGNGISLETLGSVKISENYILNNAGHGIYLTLCDGGTISKNNILNNKHGLRIGGCDNLDIYGNIILNNSIGVYAKNSRNFNIYYNNISNSSTGVYLKDMSVTKISKNNFIGNELDGNFRVGIFDYINNRWESNYYDTWSGSGPFIIYGEIYREDWEGDIIWEFDWYELDEEPAEEPYDITTTQGCGIE